MSVQFPRNNLAPESQPWGRDLEQRLAALELYRDTQATRTDNTYAGVQGSLKALGTQISQQVGTAKADASNGAGISLAAADTSMRTINTATVTAPDWAKTAIIMASSYSTIWMYSASQFLAGQTYASAQVTINGVSQGNNPMLPTSVGAVLPNYFANMTLMFTNVYSLAVTGGQIIPVLQQGGKSRTDTTSCTLAGDIHVVALFTR